MPSKLLTSSAVRDLYSKTGFDLQLIQTELSPLTSSGAIGFSAAAHPVTRSLTKALVDDRWDDVPQDFAVGVQRGVCIHLQKPDLEKMDADQEPRLDLLRVTATSFY